MLIDLTIWGMLVALALMGAFMTVERLLFHRGRAEADPAALGMRLSAPLPTLCTLRAWNPHLGWLNRALLAASGKPLTLRRLVEFEIRMTTRFQAMLGTVATAATAVGLLGTVASLYLAGTGDGNILKVISLGMGSTVAGLLIAIPLVLFEGAIRGRTGRLLDQMEAVAARLDESIASTIYRNYAPSHEETPDELALPDDGRSREPAAMAAAAAAAPLEERRATAISATHHAARTAPRTCDGAHAAAATAAPVRPAPLRDPDEIAMQYLSEPLHAAARQPRPEKLWLMAGADI